MTTAETKRGTVFGIVALLAATLFWAGNYVIGGAAVATISPLDLTAMRWVIALVPLLLLANFFEHPNWAGVAKAWPKMILPALFGPLAYNFLLYSALEHTTPVNASLINAFNPALIAIAAALVLRQRLTPVAIGGILLALLGVLWVLSNGQPAALIEHGFGLGDLLMLAAITTWTVYTIIGLRKTGIPPITATAVQCALVVITMVPVMLATGGPQIPLEAGPIWALIFIGLFPSVASFGLWNVALTKIPPARAGVFLNLITVFTVLISIILGQPLTLAQGVGGLVVLLGVALTNLGAFRRRPAQQLSPDE